MSSRSAVECSATEQHSRSCEILYSISRMGIIQFRELNINTSSNLLDLLLKGNYQKYNYYFIKSFNIKIKINVQSIGLEPTRNIPADFLSGALTIRRRAPILPFVVTYVP